MKATTVKLTAASDEVPTWYLGYVHDYVSRLEKMMDMVAEQIVAIDHTDPVEAYLQEGQLYSIADALSIAEMAFFSAFEVNVKYTHEEV